MVTAAAGRVGAGVDDLELGDRGADFEPFVVDRQCDEAGFEAPGSHRFHELDGVLADDAHGHMRMAAHEVFDEPRKQEVVGGAERSERRGASGQRACPLHDAGGFIGGCERALGLGPEQPSGVGELQAAAGPHEESDAELGLQVGDLLGDAGAGEAQDVGGSGERAVLGGGEEVGELLERHWRRNCLRHAQSISSRSLTRSR